MEQLNLIDKTIGEWFKGMPHLPEALTKWLAQNVWWIIIILVAFSVLSLFWTVLLTLLSFGFAAGLWTQDAVTAGIFGVALLAIIVSIVSLLITTFINALAISPLRRMEKKGWMLLLLAQLVGAALGIVGNIVSLNFGGVIIGMLGLAICLYVLYEIRSYFIPVKSHKKESKPEPKPIA
jgi:hypothetical protein